MHTNPCLSWMTTQPLTRLLNCCVVRCRKTMYVVVGAAAYLQLLLSLQGELFKWLDNDARIGAVIDKNGRAPHPRLQVVDGQRDVLGVVLKEKKKWERDETGDVRAGEWETRCIMLLLITHFYGFAFNYQLVICLMKSVSRGEGERNSWEENFIMRARQENEDDGNSERGGE